MGDELIANATTCERLDNKAELILETPADNVAFVDRDPLEDRQVLQLGICKAREDGVTDDEDLVSVLGDLLGRERVAIFGEQHHESVIAVPCMLDVLAIDLVDLVFVLALGQFVLQVQDGLLGIT